MNINKRRINFFKVLLILLFLEGFSFALNSLAYAGRLPPPTSFVVSILDSNSKTFVGSPASITIRIETHHGTFDTWTHEITQSPQTIPLFVTSEDHIIYITAHKEGYEDSETFVYIVTSETPKEGIIFEHTFYLNRLKPTTIYVHVKNIKNEPIEGAIINVKATRANETFVGQTNEEGIVSFESHFMNYELSVFAVNYETFNGSLVVLHESPTMHYNVTLKDLYSTTLTIIVQDESGKRLDYAFVNIVSQHANFSGKTDKNGLISFTVPCATYKITVSRNGYGTFQGSLSITNIPNQTPIEYSISLTEIPWYQSLLDFTNFALSILGYWGIAFLIVFLFVIVYFIKRKVGVKTKRKQQTS